LEETRKLPGPTRVRVRTKISELFAYEPCSQAILDSSLQQTSGGRQAHHAGAAASEASEWDSREREERLADLREEEERLSRGEEIGGLSFILSSIHSLFFLPYFLISFVLPFIGYVRRIAGGRLRLDGSGVAPIRRSG